MRRSGSSAVEPFPHQFGQVDKVISMLRAAAGSVLNASSSRGGFERQGATCVARRPQTAGAPLPRLPRKSGSEREWKVRRACSFVELDQVGGQPGGFGELTRIQRGLCLARQIKPRGVAVALRMGTSKATLRANRRDWFRARRRSHGRRLGGASQHVQVVRSARPARRRCRR